MKQIQLKIAVACSVISAAFLRNTGALALGNAAEPPSAAEEQLAQLAADEKAIKEMVAGGLTHEQAVAALKHKKDFARRHAEVTKAAKK